MAKDDKTPLEPLFPEAPEDLTALSDEDLASLETEHVTAISRIRDKDEAFIGTPEERPGDVVLAELRAGVETLKAIHAEQAEREQAKATYDAEVEALTGEVLSSKTDDEADPDEEPEADSDDAAAETEALAADETDTPEEEPEVTAEAEAEDSLEAVVAASTKPRVMRSTGSRKHQPMVVRQRDEGAGAKLVSTMEFGGVQAGRPLDRSALINLLDDAIVRTEGVTQRTVLASARAKFPRDRALGNDPAENHSLIQSIQREAQGMGVDAILASGGRCAPFTPLYDLPFVSSSRRPVTAALAGFGATRGGITYPTPLTISDAAEGITIVTAAEDEAGGGSATKTCVVVACDEFQSAETQAIAGCVEHGNFGARSWPERVDNLSDLLRVAHAQAAETALLDAIKAGSDQFADEAKYGLVSTLLQGIIKAGAQMRNRHRMEPDTTLRLLIPAWVIDAMVVDVNHVAFNRFVAHAEMTALLGRFNIVATFYLDGPTGGSMQYGANGVTNLDEFKTTVEWALFPEATWLFLDGGRLDLGLIRDSVLNATNDFQLFFETWEGAAMVGVESLWITSTVCPSGATAPAGTLITC